MPNGYTVVPNRIVSISGGDSRSPSELHNYCRILFSSKNKRIRCYASWELLKILPGRNQPGRHTPGIVNVILRGDSMSLPRSPPETKPIFAQCPASLVFAMPGMNTGIGADFQ